MGNINNFFLVFKYFKKVYFSLLLLVSILVIGSLGYVIIENYKPIEAFYMTVITMSTVGFSEIKPLSQNGQIFTAFLIMVSFGIFAYTITSITKILVSGEYLEYLKIMKTEKITEKLKNHIIVCGYGRNGKQAIKTLNLYKENVIVIENDIEKVKKLKEKNKVLFIDGDATNEDILIKAGIIKAKAIITTLHEDTNNVFVVLTARQLNSNIKIISRSSDEKVEKKMRLAGAENVIIPEVIGGEHMASLVVKPDVIEFIDHIFVTGNNKTNLEEIELNQVKDDYFNKTIKEIEKEHKTGVRIIGLKTSEGEYIVNPNPNIKLVKNTKLFALGTYEEIESFKNIF